MKIDRISHQYAKALIGFSLQHNDLKQIRADFRTLLQILKKVPKISTLLDNPELPHQAKKEFLDQAFMNKIHPKLLTFLHFLIDKERIHKLKSIAVAFTRIVSEYYGVLEVEVITAKEITEEKRELLKKKLQDHFNIEIALIEEIDSKIIGGAILVAGNKMLDDSIIGNLRSLKEKLLSVY